MAPEGAIDLIKGALRAGRLLLNDARRRQPESAEVRSYRRTTSSPPQLEPYVRLPDLSPLKAQCCDS